MKPFLFLLLAASAYAALPSAVVLPAAEIASRESAWLKANPSGRITDIHGKSMQPVIHDGDRVAYEAYVGQKLKGQYVSVKQTFKDREGHEHVRNLTHLVYDENATHVFMTGINNSRSDGWQPKFEKSGKCLVNGVLVGILRKE